jgi:hypothetical protein
MRQLRARLTYANVAATLALFVALGGSSYAALRVTGGDVVDSSLTGRDIRAGSITSSDLGRSATAARARGRRGPRGLRGPRGRNGATSVTVRLNRNSGQGLGGQATVVTPCRPGERAVGGGADTSGAAQITASVPATGDKASTDGQVPNAWLATAGTSSGSTVGQPVVTVYAVCAAP